MEKGAGKPGKDMAGQAWVPAAPPAGKKGISHHIPVLLEELGG